MHCAHCSHEQAPAFLCARCGAVQGQPDGFDYFVALGFRSHPQIDEAELQARYYELSRRLHPDRFQTASPEELAASVRATAVLNRAFQTLRDVEGRGRYWLERLGEKLSGVDRRVPPELASRVFEVQERLAELRGAQGAARESLRAELAATQCDLAEQRKRRRAVLAELLGDWPVEPPGTKGGNGAGDSRRGELKRLLSELSYLRTLDRDVQAALEE